VPPHNLPAALTAFVGREGELAELREAMTTCRLLTLNGAGGCGKTRLAEQLAPDLLDRYPGGAWFAELATVTDPDRVVAAVAQALGELDLTGDLVEVIAGRIGERETLVVLDNCEHLLEPVARLADVLLRRCPQLTILATSREPLGVPGEIAWRVPSLSHDDAIRLFTERARRARPNFKATDENADAVAQICQRLDGIPLAIELAAARVRGMTVGQVAVGLDDRFRLLTGGARTALQRQQTLQASVDWGYELLTADERSVFRRLSVFAGGFTLDAAEAVVAGDGIDAIEVLGLLLALVDKSMVNPADDTSRYSMLETLRQYGAARLVEAGEMTAARERHLAWAANLFDAVYLRATARLDFFPLATTEIDNLRAAFEWAVLTGNADSACILASTIMAWEGDLGDAAEAARVGLRAIELPEEQLRLHLLLRAVLIWAFYEVGDHKMSAAMCDVVRERLPELDADLLVRVTCQRFSSFSVRHAAFTVDALTECLRIAEQLGDQDVIAVCASMLAMNAAWRGDIATTEEYVARIESGCDTVAGRNKLSSRAIVAIMSGRFDEARALLDELAAIFLNGLPRLVVHVEAQRVLVDLAQGRDTGAAARLVSQLDDARRRRFLSGIASAGWAPGAWALAGGRLEDALSQLTPLQNEHRDSQMLGRIELAVFVHAFLAAGRVEEAAEQVARATADASSLDHQPTHFAATRTIALDGIVARARGDIVRSEQAMHEALAIQHERGWRADLVHSLEALAGIAATTEAFVECARLAGAAQRLRDDMGYVLRWPYEQQMLDTDLATARAGLGDDGFEAAFTEGRALDAGAAVAYARRARGERKRPSVGWDSLTPTETDVVRLVAEGMTNKQIGEQLFMGAETVKTHLSHVYDKLGVRSRAAVAARFADRVAG
jgi:predicted ATPase/DNA-binding CsgD family transcriptional regulator